MARTELVMAGAKTRTLEYLDPAEVAAAAAGKRGLEQLRARIAGQLPASPLQVLLGFELVEVQDGFAKLSLGSVEHLCGSMNAVPAAALSALLESAMLAAATSVLDAASAVSPAALAVHCTRSVGPRTGKVMAEGWVVHRGSRLITTEGRLSDEQRRLLAHASATYSLVERVAT